jgi:predicted DNA-binding transcriptional regulator YafY
LELLRSYLAPERRGVVERHRQTLSITWGQRDDDEIALQVEEKLRKALLEHRLIAFDYDSPASADGKPRRHTVEPWERFFDSSRGHHYLYGYCREVHEPDCSSTTPRKYIHYRLGRITHVEILPDKLPPYPPRAQQNPLIYRLAPKIARRGEVSRNPGITIERTEAQPDGAIVVYATTDNPWWAVRTLMHYGAACEILGGPEALAEIRQIARALADLYTLRENSE